MQKKVDEINALGGEAKIRYYAPADKSVVLLLKCPCGEYNNGVIATSGWCWWCGWNAPDKYKKMYNSKCIEFDAVKNKED